MADFKTILGELSLGSRDLESVRSWVEEALEQGTPQDSLLEDLEATADQLPEETVTTLREHLAGESDKDDSGDLEFDFNIAVPEAGEKKKPEKAGGPSLEDFDGSLSLEETENDAGQQADDTAQADEAPEEEDPDKTIIDPAAQPGRDTPPADTGDTDQPVHEQVSEPETTSGDRTEILPPESTDRTEVIPPEDRTDKTEVMTPPEPDDEPEDDPDKTVIGDDDPTERGRKAREAGDNPFAMTGGNRPGSASTPTGTGWPTSTAWPGQGGGHDPDSIGPGTILKDRFELLSTIGEGGMGTVYKARDLLKVEAKDRNPYIAVKLLSGDFREHPEAFIALQRESSKAQKLAHPNIATVYDFDRDGSTVYMTMELLEGEELARYIKKLPPGGLPAEEALAIIKQLCDGLEYAHARGLVHSDFKPGNCYYLSDGTVKILDFGIARASKTRTDAEGETTMFDPGQLGALTPAYATPEMFEGKEPDPRDDIYALACVSWELLQGKHPFNKLSSVKAMEKGLTPQPFAKPGFTKRQARGLIKALVFKRTERTPTITEFWDNIRYKKNKAPLYIAAGLATALVIGGLSYKPVIETMEDSRNAEIIAQLEQGQMEVPEVLSRLDQFSERARRNLLEEAKDTIIGYYEQQAEAQVNSDAGRYDYPAAQRIIEEAKRQYPDSAQLQNIETEFSDARAALIARLTGEFDRYLEQDRLMPIEGEEDITDILERMQQADPDNALLSDARLTQRYADLVETAIERDDWRQARDILSVSLAFSPDDPSLLNLEDQVTRELQRQADEKMVAEIKQRLADAQGSLDDVSDYAGIVDDLARLGQLRPDDPLLTSLQSSLRNRFVTRLQQDIQAGNWQQAEENLLAFSRMFPVDRLLEMRASLSRAEIEAGYQPESVSEQLNALSERRSRLQALLESRRFDTKWNEQLLTNFKEAIALLRPGNTWFRDMQQDIVSAYIEQAHKLVETERFDGARRLLDTGEQFNPERAPFEQQRTELAEAESRFETEQQERIRLARVAAQKNTLKVQAEANDVSSATATFESLRDSLPEDDPFINEEAPQLLAAAYERLAGTQGNRGNYANAVQFARKGLEFVPEDQGLKDALAEFSSLAEREELINMAANATPSSINRIPDKAQQVRKLFPEDATAISQEVTRTLADRIKSLESSDIDLAHRLWTAAKNLYPDNRTLQELSLRTPPKPSRYVPSGREALNKNRLSEAQEILDTAQREEPGNEQVRQFAADLQERQDQANQYFVSYQQLMRQGQKSQAKLYLEQAIRLWTDNEQYGKELAENFTTTRAPSRSADGSRQCSANLAGYGRSGRAVCYDMLGEGVRGPELIVIPAGGGFDNPFAIGKYEVSAGEFNVFCRNTGQCQARDGNPDLPVTNIPFSHMEQFVQWLSETTGKNYRIPAASEWEHAATANNPAAVKDFNCRVTQGGQVIKGLAMLEVKSGRPNPWGLTNHVGNAQEAVRGGNSVAARGGAFEDSLSSCDIQLSRQWSGNPSETTGFRVVRDID